MGDPADDSEDATSSLGDEERVRRLFQACDGDGDGFIDSHDLLNICRELNLEDSIEELMRELGADEHGRICYQEFLRRRVALRPEIDALKSTQPPQAEYIPTSSENSLGEGKLSWEFDSGARDLSPEPHTLQQLVSSAPHPASGNLLELANKLHVAALASLKAEILDLSSRLQIAQQEREHFEKALHKADAERHLLEQKMADEAVLHEEQLTELHSVIAELTRKNMHQRTMVIQEEEISETDENEASAIVDSLPPDEGGIVEASDVSSVSPEPEEPEEEVPEVVESELAKDLMECRAENAMLQERLNRALQDLEAISSRNAKKSSREPPACLGVVRTARVSSPSLLVERTSPSLINDRPCSPVRPERSVSVPKIAECVRLKKVDDQVTGSDIKKFGVCHTKVAEQLVASVQEDSDLHELLWDNPMSRKDCEIEYDRLHQKLKNVKSQNTVLGISLEQCKEQRDRLCLLVGKYESNALALLCALRSSDAALEVAEALLSLIETELALVLANCRPHNVDEDHRYLRRQAESRRQAERHARDLLGRLSGHSGLDWAPSDEGKLRDRLVHFKSERNACKSTVVELESLHVEPVPRPVSEARKLDWETAVIMQELMSARDERFGLRLRVSTLERERAAQEVRVAAQRARLQALMPSLHHIQSQINEGRFAVEGSEHQKRMAKEMEEVVAELNSMADLSPQGNAAMSLNLRVANKVQFSVERCKKRYQSKLKKLETQMEELMVRHTQQMEVMRLKVASMERGRKQEETNI